MRVVLPLIISNLKTPAGAVLNRLANGPELSAEPFGGTSRQDREEGYHHEHDQLSDHERPDVFGRSAESQEAEVMVNDAIHATVEPTTVGVARLSMSGSNRSSRQ